MPKIKTHSGAKKRFRITATGKIKFKKSGLRHLLTGASRKLKRRLRKLSVLKTPSQVKIVKEVLQRR